MPEEAKRRSILVGIAERVLTALFFFAVAFMWVGSTRQKVNQKVSSLEEKVAMIEKHEKEQEELVTKMNLQGSVATTTFITQYDKDQKEQNVVIKHLQEETGHLEAMQKTLDRLERKIGDP